MRLGASGLRDTAPRTWRFRPRSTYRDDIWILAPPTENQMQKRMEIVEADVSDGPQPTSYCAEFLMEKSALLGRVRL